MAWALRHIKLLVIILAVAAGFVISHVTNRKAARRVAESELSLGELVVTSGTVLASDPMYLRDWEEGAARIAGVPPGRYPVRLFIHEEGGDRRVARVALVISEEEPDARRLLGEVAVDSGSACFIDAGTEREFFLLRGTDRVGEFIGAKHRVWAERVKREFGLAYAVDGEYSSHLLAPVPEELERRIRAFLEKNGTGSFVFSIRTNSTYDRIVAEMDRTYVSTFGTAGLVLDEASGANVTAFSSGYGDGSYEVYGHYREGRLVRAEIVMID